MIDKYFIRKPSQYTEVLINIMENKQTRPYLDEAMSDYPLYESKLSHEDIPNFLPTREEINTAILDHYKYREIGFETVGRFLDELHTALNEIMPYYNQILYSMDLDYDVIASVDYTKTIKKEKESEVVNKGNSSQEGSDTSTSNVNVEAYSKKVQSSTPQSQLSITNKQIDKVNYADDVTWQHDSNSSTGKTTASTSTSGSSTMSGTSNDAEDTLEKVHGNYGVISAQDLVQRYRELIVNIKQDIIRNQRIRELFLTVY